MLDPVDASPLRRGRALLPLLLLSGAAVAHAESPRPSHTIAIPGGEAGVGYDDIRYAPTLKRILVPAGRTGRLAFIDPSTHDVATISGFSAASSYQGGHGQGTTSAAELAAWPGFVVATDRGANALKVVDTRAAKITHSVKLAAAPDYVRVAATRRQVWVTEPARKQIEILRIEGEDSPRLMKETIIRVPDGPESLVIDGVGGKAYSQTWKDHGYAIDLTTRKIVATWSNGCRGARGLAFDAARGLLFTGCAEGKVTVVDLGTHTLVSTAVTGPEVDSIDYAAATGHLYVPAGGSADLWIFDVAPGGALVPLGRVPTAPDAHTVAFDPGSRSLFVGTPANGVVLVLPDAFPARPQP